MKSGENSWVWTLDVFISLKLGSKVPPQRKEYFSEILGGYYFLCLVSQNLNYLLWSGMYSGPLLYDSVSFFLCLSIFGQKLVIDSFLKYGLLKFFWTHHPSLLSPLVTHHWKHLAHCPSNYDPFVSALCHIFSLSKAILDNRFRDLGFNPWDADKIGSKRSFYTFAEELESEKDTFLSSTPQTKPNTIPRPAGELVSLN